MHPPQAASSLQLQAPMETTPGDEQVKRSELGPKYTGKYNFNVTDMLLQIPC